MRFEIYKIMRGDEMIEYRKDEIISITEFTTKIAILLKLNSLIEYSIEKLAISKNNKLVAIIIPIDEYERLKDAYKKMENMKICTKTSERLL